MNEQQQPEKKSRSAEARGKRNSSGGGPNNKKLRATISPGVLKAVADSQFLTTKELGRLLLLTSKELTVSTFPTEDNMWRSLCLSHLGIRDGATILETLLAEPLSMSAGQCFRNFILDLPPKYTQLRPLKYAPKDYLVMVAVRDTKKDQPIFSKAIPGKDIPEFFETGDLKVTFETLLSSKTIQNAIDDDNHLDEAYYDEFLDFEWESIDDDGHLDEAHYFLDFEWESTVRIFRYPDPETIGVVEVKTITHGYEILEETRPGVFCSQWWSMSNLKDLRFDPAYGDALLDHCFRGARDDYNRIELELDPEFRYVVCEKNRNATIGISGFSLISWLSNDEAGNEKRLSVRLRGKNVTFAHFLEGLSHWFTP